MIFPGGRRGKAPSDTALPEVVRQMNDRYEGAPPLWRDAKDWAVVLHGLRSTFRDWAGETHPEGREVVEAALPPPRINDKSGICLRAVGPAGKAASTDGCAC